MTHKYSLVLALGLLMPWASNAMVQVGAGSYTTQLPAGQKGPSDQNNNAVLPKVVANFAKPTMTSKWWTSLIWQFNVNNPYSENLFAHPLSFHFWATGIDIGYPSVARITPETLTDKGYKTQEYHFDPNPDFTVSVVGLNAPKAQVVDYSDWTVTGILQDAGHSLQATIGTGLPYIYMQVAGGNFSINFKGNQTIWSNTNGVLGLTINGKNYGIFAPAGSTWNGLNTGTITSSLNGKNYISIAALPDNSAATLEYFRQHAYAFVTGSQVSWNYDAANGQVVSTYTVQTSLQETGNNNLNVPLLALYRHQWLNTNATFTPYSFVSNCGAMKVLEGNTFSIALAFDGVLPELPLVAVDGQNTFSKQQLFNYVDTIFKQTPDQRWQNTFTPPSDTYWQGKAFCRVAHLIRIAEQVGHTAARDLFLNEVRSKLTEWFTTGGNGQFYYDSNWDTVIGYPSSYGSDTQLSDHHFHYGYFIQAAAIVAQYDQAWASDAQYGGMVKLLIKDLANIDRTDKNFAFLRIFDPYRGHSWANGAALFGSGNNEESSSEAMNAYSGIIMWGAATGNNALRDVGIYLYTHERASIEQYWFNINNQVFPTGFNRPCVGMIWSDGGSYAIWWDGFIEECHGINFIPIQGGSLYHGRNPAYLQTNQNYMMTNGGNNNSIHDDWRDIHMSIMALYNPAAAIALLNGGYTPEAGETQAHTYHWVHNLNILGQVDTTVHGNIPTSAVFNKNGTRTYVAYNPTNAAATVTFSDNTALQVPAFSLVTNGSTPTPPPPTPAQFAATAAEASSCVVTLNFTPSNWTPKTVTLHLIINTNAQQNIPLSANNNAWNYMLSGLNAGDKITYWYTYDYNGASQDSAQTVYTYNACNAVVKPVFTQWVERRTAIKFQPQWQSNAVSLTYSVNNSAAQTVSLTQSNGVWSTILNGIKTGDVVTYTFTYDFNGANSTSQQFTYSA